MKTGLVWDERFMWYDFGSYTRLFNTSPYIQPGTAVESPESKRRIVNLLAVAGLLSKLDIIEPQPASRKDLLRVHSEEYVDRVEKISAENGGDAGAMAPVPKFGYDLARLAVGGTMAGIEAVLTGRVKNAYVLTRPPGHHAERDYGMGLCIFANVAIAVKAAQAKHNLKRVAILDWDAHHGNGYESAFIDDPSVLTISIHQDLAIVGRGGVEDNGTGAGEGFNINIPLPPASGTGTYLAAFDRVVAPALTRFQPELIVVASGLDAASNDPTARMLLKPESYRLLTERIMKIADEVCDGRLVMSHEGGYDATLAPFCALSIFEQMSGIKPGIPEGGNPFTAASGGGSQYDKLQPHQHVYIESAEALLKNLEQAIERTSSDS